MPEQIAADVFEVYEEEWLAALRLITPLITKQDLIALVTRTRFEEQTPSASGINIAYFRLWEANPKRNVSTIEIVMHRAWRSMHEIERIEALLWCAIVAHIWLSSHVSWNHLDPSAEHRAYCKNLGVAPTSLCDPSKRWALIERAGGTTEALRSLAPWPNECVVCARPITSDEPREDVHKNCMYYVQTTLVSQHAAELARAAELEAIRLEQEEMDDAAF